MFVEEKDENTKQNVNFIFYDYFTIRNDAQF